MRLVIALLCSVCLSNNALAEPIQLDDSWLDTIVAGRPVTGVEVISQVSDGDNDFALSRALFSEDPNKSAGLTVSCGTDSCTGFGFGFFWARI